VATRLALLDAAVECLCVDGYAAVTTTKIADRAGVSRGAQLHHFPTKAELMAAAVEHLLSRRLMQFRDLVSTGDLDLGDIDGAIDVLWELYQGPTFVAFAELWLAARTDVDLAAVITEVERRFTAETRLIMIEFVSGVGLYDPWALEMFRDFAFALMNGITFERLVPRGQRPASDYLELLKGFARRFLTDHRVQEERHDT
jgi:AcrR family transcriptional regulator